MKSLLLTIICSVSVFISHSQYAWIQKSNFVPGNRANAYCFAIGSTGYVGSGVYVSGSTIFPINDFWAYDFTLDTWTQKANIPASTRSAASGFVADGCAYICLGLDYSTNTFLNDLWCYNPITNSWLQKANFPGAGRYTAVSFGIGNFGFVGLGKSGPYHTDMYKYNSGTDTWSPITAPVISPRQNSKGFVINGLGYLLGGANEFTGTNCYDFWQYNPQTDTWTQKTSYPGQGSYALIAFELNNYGFAGTGAALPYAQNLTYSDFYRYDPQSDTWLAIVNFGGGIRNSASFFSFGNRAFAGLGAMGVFPVLNYQSDWWELVNTTGLNENTFLENHATVCAMQNQSVKFDFKKPLTENVTVNIFDLTGRLISENVFQAGRKCFFIDLNNDAEGIYGYEIITGKKKLQSGKFLLN